jgi:hypothetical protein
MNAAIVFFVIGVGVAAVLLANRLATRGQRPRSRDSDGGSRYANGSEHGAVADDRDADTSGADSGGDGAGGDGGSGGGGDGGGGD